MEDGTGLDGAKAEMGEVQGAGVQAVALQEAYGDG